MTKMSNDNLGERIRDLCGTDNIKKRTCSNQQSGGKI